MDVKERFLRYVTFHTTSDEESGTVPSTPRQRVLGQALAEELAALGVWQKDAVLAARLAPSAANFQPWKIEADRNSVSILEASVIYKKYAPLDRGIAMLHAAVGAYHAGREAVWKKVDGGYQMRA